MKTVFILQEHSYSDQGVVGVWDSKPTTEQIADAIRHFNQEDSTEKIKLNFIIESESNDEFGYLSFFEIEDCPYTVDEYSLFELEMEKGG